MNKLLFGGNGQGASNLECDIQSLDRGQGSFPLHAGLDGFAVNELHDIKIVVLIGPKIEDGRDIRMA